MKELTIEQKAKAYDEAFRIAQELYNDPNSSNVGKGYVCTVFPEVKESDDENIRKWIIAQLELKSDVNNPHDLELMILKSIAWLEKQGEQKPTDKVKPKFNVGDWVVNKLGDSWHIDSFDKKNYQVSDGKGKYNYFPISKQDEMHLWAIQDEKDGDVLSYRNGQWIFIFKRRIDKDSFEYYALWSTIHNDLTINDSAFSLLTNSIYPATQEQRDTLFAKMKEAGYEWDVKKKELKKQEIAEIPFGAKDSELQEATYYIPKGFKLEINGNKVIIKKGE